MRKFGGEMRFRLSTGQAIVMRGQVEVMPASINSEGVVNQDGSIAKTATLTGRRANLTFEDGGEDWEGIMRADGFNVSIVEDYTGVLHAFTDATMVGEPSVNRLTGELTGVSILSQSYRRSAA